MHNKIKVMRLITEAAHKEAKATHALIGRAF